jgi:toxin ParE1/3/4
VPRLVEVHEDAIAEVHEAMGFYLARGDEPLAERFAAVLDAAFELLAATPGVGRQFDRDESVRAYPLRRFPFLVVYEVADDRIVVRALVHQRRGPVVRAAVARKTRRKPSARTKSRGGG